MTWDDIGDMFERIWFVLLCIAVFFSIAGIALYSFGYKELGTFIGGPACAAWLILVLVLLVYEGIKHPDGPWPPGH